MVNLLGKCPECGTEDKIIQVPYEKDFSNFHKVRCEDCETIWDDWLNLKFSEEKRNNKLIPVEVKRYENDCVKLNWPSKRDVPCSGLIVTVLNSALITKFSLDVCLATEGGIQKISRNGYELRNIDNCIGLYTNYGKENAGRAYNFYEKMMRQLFEESLSFGNVNFRKGEILWLENNKDNYNNSMIYLFGTLTSVESRKFAERVLKTRDEVAKNPFSAPYIRGLSDEEIAKFFVPPLLH